MDKTQWPMPKTIIKSDGTPRQVGVEFELQGVAVDMLARLIGLTLRGEVETISAAEYCVRVPDHGDYRVRSALCAAQANGQRAARGKR